MALHINHAVTFWFNIMLIKQHDHYFDARIQVYEVSLYKRDVTLFKVMAQCVSEVQFLGSKD